MQSESSSNQAPNAFQTQHPNHFRNFHCDRIQNELQIHAKRHLQNVLQNRMQKGLQIGSQNELKMKVPNGSQNEFKNKLKMTTKNDSRIEGSKSQPKWLGSFAKLVPQNWSKMVRKWVEEFWLPAKILPRFFWSGFWWGFGWGFPGGFSEGLSGEATLGSSRFKAFLFKSY